jgi:hypothetical protein
VSEKIEPGSVAVDGGLDLLWGYKEIAAAMNVKPSKAMHLLAEKKIPAMRVGEIGEGKRPRYVISREELRRFFNVPK